MTYNIEQKDVELVNSRARITYEISFPAAARHLMHVSMIVSNVNTDKVRLVFPVWAPGSYKVRDFCGYHGNHQFQVLNNGTPADTTHRWLSKCEAEISTNGSETIMVHYVVFANERTVRTNHINRFHASIMPVATLPYVEGRMDEVHHVRLLLEGTQWHHISTALSPVANHGDRGQVYAAANYDILADSPIEIGNHAIRTFQVDDIDHEVALVSAFPLDADWIAEQIRKIVIAESVMFEGIPYDRYVFIIHSFPGVGGGLEHARSSVNAIDPLAFREKTKAVQALSLLCHEYFHLWNIKRIRPIELGPFDYKQENYTTMLWLAEGVTSYYDDLFAYRCGFTTETEFLKILANDHLGKLARVPGRKRMSVKDSSLLAWVKLYMQSPDGANRFPSYYLKGGVIMLLLDLYVIEHTDGNRRLDDGMRGLWKRYLDNPDVGVTEAECIAIWEHSFGIQIRERLTQWLSEMHELPVAEALVPFGIELITEMKESEPVTLGEQTKIAESPVPRFAGWALGTTNGRVVVKSIEDDGPADVAGIGIDDELVTINDVAVSSVEQAETLLAGPYPTDKVAVTAICDGRAYQTTMTPIRQQEIRLSLIPNATPQQETLRKTWLKRYINVE